MPQNQFTRRQRGFLRWSARAIIVALVFQFVAVDHWHPDPAQVVGVQNSQAHQMHCHGGASGCANSASFTGSLADASLVLTPSTEHLVIFSSSKDHPRGVTIAGPDEPPRLIA